MDRQTSRLEVPAPSVMLVEPACAVALFHPPAPCSQAGFPSVSAEHLPFHCSLPSTLPDVFQKSQLRLGGNRAKRVFASESEIPEDCSGRKIRPQNRTRGAGKCCQPSDWPPCRANTMAGRSCACLGKAVHQLSSFLVTIPFWSNLQLALASCLTTRDFSGMIHVSGHELHLSHYKTSNTGRVHSLVLKGPWGRFKKKMGSTACWMLLASLYSPFIC